MPWYDMPLERLREYRTTRASRPGSTPGGPGGSSWRGRRPSRPRSRRTSRTSTGRSGCSTWSSPARAGIRCGRGTSGRPPSPPASWSSSSGTAAAAARRPSTCCCPRSATGCSSWTAAARAAAGRSARPPTQSTGPENAQVMTRGHHDARGLLLHPDVHRRGARRGRGARASRAATPWWRSAAASQGGGLALAAAALHGDTVAVCHADVPFLCDIQRAITLAPHAPYTEIPEFLAENVALIDTALNTLRYIDCALLARRITATSLLSVGLMDDHLPAVHGVRRLQRDHGGQGHRRVPVQRAQRAARARRAPAAPPESRAAAASGA